MACLANAGVRDYTARLEGSIVFWVYERTFAKAVKALVDGGFTVAGIGVKHADSWGLQQTFGY
jgi:hypothetical protein